MNDEGPGQDRRGRKARRTREALAEAACTLVCDRGLKAVTVEDIADRADVTRRTFSRYFSSKEDAVLDSVRADGDRINDALRSRPADEPPLVAYRNAVDDWLSDDAHPAWHRRPRIFELMRIADGEPTLYAAFQHIRVEAQADSIRILAARMGVDHERDLRPAVLVGAGAGALVAAQAAWVRSSREDALPGIVHAAFAALAGELPQG
ncbi:TetR family transcriptional regulator [Streptomyces sp. NBC_01387]|uniref:TetR/AcrR family transcriptional regulator n=1 Tax=unclassified Streptomyces TaxID=2593676 RepID=UPI002DDB1C03|nr:MULTISPECIES: TetR family transcriptional regulator [unclassified Streptomyces]WSC24098.1 TetR family transcriptional regulator [Streptomyces sp. NBC_01766]WSV57984.1 TetR family transcriptional regulator [Streptomyces sp. NBC_01014]